MVALEPIHGQILGVYISRHRNMLVTELFLKSLVKLYGKHTVYSDGGPCTLKHVILWALNTNYTHHLKRA